MVIDMNDEPLHAPGAGPRGLRAAKGM